MKRNIEEIIKLLKILKTINEDYEKEMKELRKCLSIFDNFKLIKGKNKQKSQTIINS